MEFTFVGGHPGLDLLATQRYRNRQNPEELLSAPEDLARWCVEAGLLTESPDVTAAELGEVLSFREVGYRLTRAASQNHGFPSADREVLNRYAAGEPIRVALGPRGRMLSRGTTQQVLATIARQFVPLLAESSTASLRQCDGSECTRFFVDRSRAQNRRFCSDRLCGNRAKVAAFRERASSSPGLHAADSLRQAD
jgi:predicted RNA-binding Zn ribbon-like protein